MQNDSTMRLNALCDLLLFLRNVLLLFSTTTLVGPAAEHRANVCFVKSTCWPLFRLTEVASDTRIPPIRLAHMRMSSDVGINSHKEL